MASPLATPVATWQELCSLFADGFSGAVALPPVIYVDRAAEPARGRVVDVLACATTVRFAPGESRLFSVPGGATLRLAGSMLVEPGDGTESVVRVDAGGTLALDAAVLAREAADVPVPTTCLVECLGTGTMGPCAAIDGWRVAAAPDGSRPPCALRVSGEGAVFSMGGGRVTGCTNLGADAAPGAAVQVLDGARFNLEGGVVQRNNHQEGESTLYGGGFFVERATLVMSGGSVESNAAVHGAGVYCVGRGRVEVSGGRICANRALHRGGGIYSTGTVELTGGDVSDNRASFGGGAFNAGTLRQAGAVVGSNAADSGAGLYNRGELSVEGGSIVKNAADGFQGSGGGVYNTGRLFLGPGIVTGNRALYTGGGVYNTRSGRVEMDGAGLSHNRALYGGGVYNAQGRVSVASGDIVDNCANSTQFGGGGVYNTGELLCGAAAIVHNASQGMGGGVYNTGTVRLKGTGLSHNAAMNGGGVYNRGLMEAAGCAVVHNSAGDMGGGVVNTGTMAVEGGTVAHNGARRGGGVLNAGTARVVGTLLGRNEAETARDLYNYLDDGSRGVVTLTVPAGDGSLEGLAWHDERTGGPGGTFEDGGEELLLTADPVCEVRLVSADGDPVSTRVVRPGTVVGHPGGAECWREAETGVPWDFSQPVERDLLLVADEPEQPALPGDVGRDGADDAPAGGGLARRRSPIESVVVWTATAAGAVSGLVRRRGGAPDGEKG